MMSLKATRPCSTRDLSPSESLFVNALHQLRFGRIESIKIRRGGVVLDPGPTAVQVLKFGSLESDPSEHSSEFELKKPIAELLEYIRGVDNGEIRRLEIRHGLPSLVEVEYRIS